MDIKKIRVQHLQELLEALGGAASLSKSYDDINPSYLSQLINGHRPFGEKSARKLEKKLELEPYYFDRIFDDDINVNKNTIEKYAAFAKDDDSFFLTDNEKLKVEQVQNKYNLYQTIKQYDASGAMGNGILLREQSGIIHEWFVSEDWVQKNLKGYSNINNICIITGFGDSMNGLYNSGDPLIMDKGITTVEHDGVYFFRIENEGFIKRLQRIPGQGIKVISDNKKYDPWFIQDGMDFQVFGKVIKAWQGFDL